jgi:N,N'-diacetyllegionaminate synthase
MKTLIIAEAGVNHNGDMGIAKELIEIASQSGADMVKFQTFSAERLATPTAGKAEYQLKTTDSSESQYEMLKKLEITEVMHRELIAHCKLLNIGFLSTGFDIESVNMLVGLGQNIFKIPSGEIINFPLIQHIGRLGKQVILSTGMAQMEEIEAAIGVLEVAGTPRSQIVVLHCTSAYPVPMSDVNLSAMRTINEKFNVSVGYSDHTLGIEIPIAAVALGAVIIEKHFTLDRNLPGPDHKASLEPTEFKAMVSGIRNIEEGLGDGIKRPMPSELLNLEIVRKSIVASTEIKKGELLTAENLTTKRPGSGLSPIYWDSVLGTQAIRSYLKDEFIEL